MTEIHAYNDFFIRYLFGDERNKDLLLSFINAVHEDSGFPLIASVEIKNPFNLKEIDILKETTIDIKAADEQGRLYDIEVQVDGSNRFKHRSLYYWAKMYTSQLATGNRYTELRPVICINLLAFEMFKEIQSPHSCFYITEKTNPELVLTDHLLMHFIELPHFSKEDNISTMFELWLAFFKYEGKREEIMRILLQDKSISKAHHLYQSFVKNDALTEIYEAREKWLKDQATREYDARQEGKAEGRAEGKIEGVLEGRHAEKRQIALDMRKEGVAIEVIARCTGLSVDEINELSY